MAFIEVMEKMHSLIEEGKFDEAKTLFNEIDTKYFNNLHQAVRDVCIPLDSFIHSVGIPKHLEDKDKVWSLKLTDSAIKHAKELKKLLEESNKKI